jgi:hypothetical protein
MFFFIGDIGFNLPLLFWLFRSRPVFIWSLDSILLLHQSMYAPDIPLEIGLTRICSNLQLLRHWPRSYAFPRPNMCIYIVGHLR